ncbi:unnamed protein product [Anisakis simplex]|uniref:Uncharacterized protein n=1 Tax=Anisakis simplex TaxID=6269 RepID=A0A3P6NA23_ANISI|nr:unnamed protein product [Anisakis simplex]
MKRRYEPEDSSVEDKLMAGYIDGTAYRFGSAEDQEMINSHRNSNRNMSKNRKRGYSLNASNLICGANCFRLNMDEQSRKQLSTSNNKELNIKTEMGTVDDTSAACNDQWTISQQSMFVVLKRIYKNDFCKITNSLNCIDPDAPRKTCAQVYAYSLRNAPLSPRGELSPNSPKKKKYMKDQHRTFRATKWASTEGKVTNRHNYEPCSHKGPCSDQNCNCVIVGNVCAKLVFIITLINFMVFKLLFVDY